jgi:hypothetical protein
MTVAELISKLRELPGDPDLLTVVVAVGRDNDTQVDRVHREGVTLILEPVSMLRFDRPRRW